MKIISFMNNNREKKYPREKRTPLQYFLQEIVLWAEEKECGEREGRKYRKV